MIYRVLLETKENPSKNDFVEICNKYLKDLDLKMSFEEIRETSKHNFKKIVYAKVKQLGFRYLLRQKSEQSKAKNVQYSKFEIQEYLIGGNCKREVAKMIFKARTMSVDIKMNKKWKYGDVLCVGCGEREETVDEILLCRNLNYENSVSEYQVSFKDFFSSKVKDLVRAGLELMKSWKNRKSRLEKESAVCSWK